MYFYLECISNLEISVIIVHKKKANSVRIEIYVGTP